MLNMTAIGNLGKDAEIKEVNGKKVINFSIAHTEKWKDKNGTVNTRTIWVECALWEKAGLAPYLKQGVKVWVSGAPSAIGYMNKENKPQSSMRLNVFQLELCGSKKEGDENNGTSAPTPSPEDVDDLPF